MLIPMGVTGNATITDDSIDAVRRYLSIVYRGGLPKSGTLFSITARVAIGDTDRTTLRFDSIAVASARHRGSVQVSGEDGRFATLGLCTTGGLRLVTLAPSVTMLRVDPNPAHDRLRVVLKANDRSEVILRMVDLTGRVVQTLFSGMVEQGEVTIERDISELAPGTYLIEQSGRAGISLRAVTVRR